MIKLTKDMFGCFKDDDHNEVTIEIGSMNPKDVSDTILENQKLRELIDIEIIKCGKDDSNGQSCDCFECKLRDKLQYLLEESKK